MEMQSNERCCSCFRTGESAQERGLSHLPEVYKVAPSLRPSSNPSEVAHVPIIDLSGLRMGPTHRFQVIQSIRQACLHIGFFHVVNHGIKENVVEKALSAASGFFELPLEERTEFMSSDVHKPVRYGTSLKDGVDKIQFWRIFLKHYSNPLEDWVDSWPHNPSNYREDMGNYTTEVMKLAAELTEAVTESLGLLRPNYLTQKLQRGMQVMALNCYPPCPEPRLALGLPPHSDYSCLTILLQSSPGLELMMDTWKLVPLVPGALQVHIGDHFEVLSNGIYKSVAHRVKVNTELTRISLASLHSLGREEKMAAAEELVDERRPRGYRESSFQDFVEFLSKNDLSDQKKQQKSFLNTLKIEI